MFDGAEDDIREQLTAFLTANAEKAIPLWFPGAAFSMAMGLRFRLFVRGEGDQSALSQHLIRRISLFPCTQIGP